MANCPQCAAELRPVTYGGGMLSREQWEAIRAGDFFCVVCPDNDRGNSGHAYFWANEVREPTHG